MSHAPSRSAAPSPEEVDAAIAADIAALRARTASPVLVGLSGPQGSGKSSTAARMIERLRALGLAVAARSLDDFYLTRAERAELARTVHPLLATRGPPGTHDVPLIEATLDRLMRATGATRTPLPSFDKARDDRIAESSWPVFEGAPDVVLLEGWCLGARPQPASALGAAVNALEEAEDREGRWRTYVNDRLAGPYAALHDRLQRRYMLRAPSFDTVFAWRAEQEAGLDRRSEGAHPPMDATALRRFIAHYERITRWMMADRPADLVVELGADRMPLGMTWR